MQCRNLSAVLEFPCLHAGFTLTCTWNPGWFAGEQKSALQSPERCSWISPTTHSANTSHPLIPSFQIERVRSALWGIKEHRHLPPLNVIPVLPSFKISSVLKGTPVTPLEMQTFNTKTLEDNRRWHWWAMVYPGIRITILLSNCTSRNKNKNLIKGEAPQPKLGEQIYQPPCQWLSGDHPGH